MSNPVFVKIPNDLSKALSDQAKITKLNVIINLLLDQVLTTINSGKICIVEYELDTGQTRTNVTYSKPDEIFALIKNYENLIKYYENRNSPRVKTLIDISNLNRRR